MAVCKEQGMADELHDLVECSICSDVYTDPRILPCIHTFCLNCIEMTGIGIKPGQKLPCPLCREEFTIPQEGFTGLKKNFFMSRIIEIRNITSPPLREKFCDPCVEDNEDQTVKYPVPFAESFCIECHQNLCPECCNHHRKNKVSKIHKVVHYGAEIDASALAASSLCAQHPTKPLEMLCMECQTVICMMCFVESHHLHKCADIHRLAPEFKNTLKVDVKKISALRADAFKETGMIKKASINLLADISITDSAIIKRGKELKQLVDQHTELLLKELAHLKAMKAKEIEMKKEDADRHITMLDSYKAYCLSVVEKGSAADICQAGRELHDRAAALETAHKSRLWGFNSLRNIFQLSPLRDWLDKNYNIVGKLQDLPLLQKSVPFQLPSNDVPVVSQPNLISSGYPNSQGGFTFSNPIPVTRTFAEVRFTCRRMSEAPPRVYRREMATESEAPPRVYRREMATESEAPPRVYRREMATESEAPPRVYRREMATETASNQQSWDFSPALE